MKKAVSKEVAVRVLKLLDKGLVKGLGTPVPGKMCVEAAVCYAMDLPHSDQPTCVAEAVRVFKIQLNDAAWSSNKARADGLRRIAVAQLGSESINQVAFSKEVAFQTIRQILPIVMRNIGLEKEAAACETAIDLSAARSAAVNAAESVKAARHYEWSAEVNAAESAARSAAESAEWSAESAESAARAAESAEWSAESAARAAARAAESAEWSADNILQKAAEIGVQALIKVGAVGVQWLDLC